MTTHAELVVLEEHYADLVTQLFGRRDVETAAFLRCGVADAGSLQKLLVRQVISVREDHYLRRDADGLSLDSPSYAYVLKAASREKDAVVLVHSHPQGPAGFSIQDDSEERRLFPCVHTRIPARPHASIVLTSPGEATGRIWHHDGTATSLERITVVGSRLHVLGTDGGGQVPVFFDRQVRAFGPDVQALLRSLRVGIVGVGGTGSAVFELLLRLGVGRILVIDPDHVDESNLSRIHESRAVDVGQPKVSVPRRSAQESGLPSAVEVLCGDITQEGMARRLRECDVIFGCTDRHLPRTIQCRLSTRYLIPVFDLGVVVESAEGLIRSIVGRVTTVLPGTSCLVCRRRIDPQRIRAESMLPAEWERQAAEGYIPELGVPDPAIMPFTTGVAAFAVSEFLHRLTGFMGDRRSSETLLLFHVPEVHSNADPAEAWCDCASPSSWGRGDEDPFLGMTWRRTPNRYPA
jgi:molybdopterin/thiamine biosynthesis adenylyltransferase/proteasome lid subunit RPN8/RPN11